MLLSQPHLRLRELPSFTTVACLDHTTLHEFETIVFSTVPSYQIILIIKFAHSHCSVSMRALVVLDDGRSNLKTLKTH